jgi:DNA ligase-1
MSEFHCTLAKVWNPDKQNVTGWYYSEKLDGVRALWCPKRYGFFSRSNKPLNVPTSWQHIMRNVGIPLDGEFFMGRGRFQDTVSAVRKKSPTEEDFKGVEYVVFDYIPHRLLTPSSSCLHSPVPFSTRINHCKQATLQLGDKRVRTLDHHIVDCMGDVVNEYDRIMSSGGEGIMFRNPHMEYEFKRSSNLLKWKNNIDGKATVTELQAGEGKHEGRLGALVVMDNDTGAEFKVGTGFSDDEREQKWPMGTVIRWRAMELTRGGIPRFPVFVCIDEGD